MADDGVAPAGGRLEGYRSPLGCFSTPGSEFSLTYRLKLIDEVSVWGEKGRIEEVRLLGFTHPALFMRRAILLHGSSHDIIELMRAANTN